MTRRLSKYQSQEWMTAIRKKRKWNPSWKGEDHPMCRLPDEVVDFIKSSTEPAKLHLGRNRSRYKSDV